MSGRSYICIAHLLHECCSFVRTFVGALTAPAKRHRQHIKDYSSYRAIVPPAPAMTARPARPSSRSADKPSQGAGWSTAFLCGAQKSPSKAIYKGKRVRPRAVFGHSDHVFAPLFEPAVLGVKLASQNQPDGFGHTGPLVARRQRSEQYFTWPHSLAHFLRQANGRPQWWQGLLGRPAFPRTA